MFLRTVAVVLASISILATTGCFNSTFIKPTQDLIDAYIMQNPNLPELDKSCIADGRFEVGMLQETVRFLLGEPKTLEVIQQPWAKQEKWTYDQGGDKIFYMEDKGVVGIEESN